MRQLRETVKQQIIELVAEGLTTKEIADKMCLSETTVDSYRVRILRLHNVKNSAHLISHCYKTGILTA